MAEVPDDVLEQIGQVLEEFHTAITFDPAEVAAGLTRMENAWERLKPFIPPSHPS